VTDLSEIDLPGPDRAARSVVADRATQVLRPPGALATLDELAVWLAGWQRTDQPAVARPGLAVFVGSHGVCDEGVSAYPSEINAAMATALREGVATAAVMARHLGARTEVVDVGIDRPTANLAVADAMSPDRFAEAWSVGAATTDLLIDDGCDLLVFGEMGIGNTTAAAAVAAGLFGGDARNWCGRGAGVDDQGLLRKVDVVERGVARLGPDPAPMDVLRCVGGTELVAIAAAVWRARRRSVPVLLDGYITTAAAASLACIRSDALDHCRAAHRSAEQAHGALLERLGLDPILDLGLRLGEGSGALVAVPIVALAAASVVEVATFSEWGLD
jgi:nicotinate-nucleotide--dimethylbenzimidazole phosphoribosyltransferase